MRALLAGRTGDFVGFLGCFGIVGLALYIQTRYQLEPCPLCISQRILFLCLGLLFLLGLVGRRHRLLAVGLLMLRLALALGGVGVALRHWWLQAHKQEVIADCGVGFDYMFENFPWQKALRLVFRGTGDCAAIDWTLFGLTLPQLGLISFVLAGAYAVLLFRLQIYSKRNIAQT